MLKDRRVKTGGFCKGLKLFKAELCIANGETGLNLLLVIPDFFFFFFMMEMFLYACPRKIRIKYAKDGKRTGVAATWHF